mgnify:CR=1 FL=1
MDTATFIATLSVTILVAILAAFRFGVAGFITFLFALLTLCLN